MKTVLLVEDHDVLRRAIARGLRGHFHVTASGTLASALSHFDGGSFFDAILCDMFLDDGTGEDFYERLRAQSIDQSDRILFLSGRDEACADEETAFYRATRGRHLVKPIAANVLIANLRMMAGDGAPASTRRPPDSGENRTERA